LSPPSILRATPNAPLASFLAPVATACFATFLAADNFFFAAAKSPLFFFSTVVSCP